MKFYIHDTTISNEPIVYGSILEIVKHLEGTVQRKFNLNRQQYMQNVSDLGYGDDDELGATFVSCLSEHFNIGVVQDNRYIKTNIHETLKNSRYQTECGN